MLTAAERVHSPADDLTVVARALTKHNHRYTGAFWGDVTGTVAEKNARARQLIDTLLVGTTWWNCFGHPKHEVVYEVRISSGHGARWALPTLAFVGFLEPFETGIS